METLGRYKILQEIGKGAMGVVYQAHDPEIGRTVAIKTLLNVEGGDPDAAQACLRRFDQEIRIVGRLQHPNIVALYDVGASDGTRFFVMEYIEGRTLSSWVRTEGRPPPERALRVIRAVAAALGYAHGKGIVHRDIKPSNVLLANDGAVKVADFGIAYWNTVSHDLTGGSLTGTPRYISPEQVSGAQVDRRADVFSLAVLSYELLTGKPPFDGQTVTQVIHQVLHETPELPSRVNPLLPEALNAPLMMALEKDPSRRQPDMHAFERDLEAALRPPDLEGTVAAAGPPIPDVPAVAPRPRARLLAVTLVSACLILALLGVRRIGWLGEGGDPHAGVAYAEAFERAREGKIEEARKSFEQMVEADGLADKGLVGLAYIRLRSGDHDGAERLCAQALEANPRNLYARVLQARSRFERGDADGARELVSAALQNGTGQTWERAEAYTVLGRIQESRGENEQALGSYEEAIALEPTSPVAYRNKGAMLSRMGNYQEAVASYHGLLRFADDPAVRLLAAETQRRWEREADVERRREIRSMIDDLDQRRKRARRRGGDEFDGWSSRPLNVAVYPFVEKGTPSLDAGSSDYLRARVMQGLGDAAGLHLVSREILDEVLQELQLADSALSDPDKALRVGRVAGANLIVTGSLFRLGGRLQAVLQVIETETTYVKAAASEEQAPGEALGAFSARVAGDLARDIDAAFPLQGRITRVEDGGLLLNLGREQGARPGMRFKVLPEEETSETKPSHIAIVSLTRVGGETSEARLDKAYGDIHKGQKVLELEGEDAG